MIKLLEDAKEGKFQYVLIKDVSRLARNTVDFLTSIRKLKSYGIQVIFVNYDQTSSQGSEFMLTMLSAIAQEESANTSKRVKFGKNQNAKRGRVPNVVYGYDKIIGDYFNLLINEKEAEVIRRIFLMYTEYGYGTNRIAKELNQEGIVTKRECKWSQNTVKRIIANPIYTGTVTNGREEVEDFLTGARVVKGKEEWHVTSNPNIRIISDEIFQKANRLLKSREQCYQKGEKEADTYLFSKMIYCGHCNKSFRRIIRNYKKTYIKWVCNTRNTNGVNACDNSYTIEESRLQEEILNYFIDKVIQYKKDNSFTISEIHKYGKSKGRSEPLRKEYQTRLQKSIRKKRKLIELYSNDIITLEELKKEMEEIELDISYCNKELESLKHMEAPYCMEEKISVEEVIQNVFIHHHALKRIVDKIIVNMGGTIMVYIKKI